MFLNIYIYIYFLGCPFCQLSGSRQDLSTTCLLDDKVIPTVQQHKIMCFCLCNCWSVACATLEALFISVHKES